MGQHRDAFDGGRRNMIDAFAELDTLARRAGADADAITAIHGRFFGGNAGIKDAFDDLERAVTVEDIP